MLLVIDSTKKRATEYCNVLFPYRMFAKPANKSNYREQLDRRIFKAVLFPDADDFPNLPEVCREITEEYKVAVILLRKPDSALPYDFLLDSGYCHCVIENTSNPGKIVENILYAVRDNTDFDPIDKIYSCVKFNYFYPRNTVHIFATPVELHMTEYRILKYLVYAAPRIVSTEELYEFVYRPTSESLVSNIVSNISSLNKKLFETAKFRVVCNASRKGYYIASKNKLSKEYDIYKNL